MIMEKYTLNLDDNNYVLSIAHTPNDNIELDLSEYDLTHLNAYKLVDGTLVLDQYKLEEMLAAEKKAENSVEISRLKAELSATDYQIIKCSECQLLGQDMPYDVAELHENRQAIRDKINELEEYNAKVAHLKAAAAKECGYTTAEVEADDTDAAQS